MFSKNNPFVNDTMFFANKPHYIYNQTPWHFFQITYNSTCFIIGSMLALLIFYLLAAQTPPNLKSYRKMLLLVTAVDYFTLLIVCGIYYRLRFVGTTLIVTHNGFYTTIFSYHQLCPVMGLYVMIGSIGISVLPVQYFYRYYALEKDKPPSTFLVLALFCLFVAPCLIVSPKTATVSCPAEDPNPNNIDYGPMWFEEVPIPELFVLLGSEKSIWFNSGTVLISVFYLITVFYGALTVRKLKVKFLGTVYSKSAKSLQRQLTKTMIVQFALPLIVLIFPQVFHQIIMNLDIANERFAEFSKQSFVLVPIFNMLACITFIKPYRRFCLRFLPCSKYYNCLCTTGVGPA